MARKRNNNGLNKDILLNEDEVNKSLSEIRVPPYSKELELNVLGGMIIDNSLIDIVMTYLKPEDFYINKNQIIYKTICDLKNLGEPVDLVILTEELRMRNLLDEVGGPSYLVEITNYYVSLESLKSVCDRILGYSVKRDLIKILYKIQEQSYDLNSETEKVLDNAQHEILDITNYLQKKNYIHISKEAMDTMKYVESIHEKTIKEGSTIFGVPSGFEQLDKYTGGFQNSELIVIAGRPSHGKTAFALNIARNAALDYNKNIGIFSIEMSVRELALRFICLEAKVDISDLKTGRLKPKEWGTIGIRTSKLMNYGLNIVIDDSSPLSLIELRAKARRMKTIDKIDMIIVDYLQLMDVSHLKRYDNRYLEIGIITRSLKHLAKELDIPILALSQLSRKVEDRPTKEKRPQLADLRESGSIEQDADVVIFVNRPELYLSKSQKDEEAKKLNTDERCLLGLAEIIIGKQRNGPIGEVDLAFIKNYAGFSKIAKETPSYHALSEPF